MLARHVGELARKSDDIERPSGGGPPRPS